MLKIYYTWIIELVFENKEIQKEFSFKTLEYISLESFWNEFQIGCNQLNDAIILKLNKVFRYYNIQIRKTLEIFALSLINYSISKEISLLDRTKDSLKYFIRKYTDKKKQDKIIAQMKTKKLAEHKQEKILIFDPEINYLIKRSIGISYFIPEPYEYDIKLTKEQNVLIQNVIALRDTITPGFIKMANRWKYSGNEPLHDIFDLDTLNEVWVTNTSNSWVK